MTEEFLALHCCLQGEALAEDVHRRVIARIHSEVMVAWWDKLEDLLVVEC